MSHLSCREVLEEEEGCQCKLEFAQRGVDTIPMCSLN